jgi:hypothetical protein
LPNSLQNAVKLIGKLVKLMRIAFVLQKLTMPPERGHRLQGAGTSGSHVSGEEVRGRRATVAFIPVRFDVACLV